MNPLFYFTSQTDDEMTDLTQLFIVFFNFKMKYKKVMEIEKFIQNNNLNIYILLNYLFSLLQEISKENFDEFIMT